MSEPRGVPAWFSHDRFGMFIHWGLYALPARHEWVMAREQRDLAEYERYTEFFDPDLYDPVAWAKLAKAAGMRYVVITTKHHEGFCLWDSALTDYKATNTPAGRDLIAEFVEAVRGEGLRVGFYHSLLDWHHPDYPIDGIHPRREDPTRFEANETRDIAGYREYLHGQVRELLTNYGPVDYLFYDFSWAGNPHTADRSWNAKGNEDWGGEELMALTRELQPGIIVNDRLGIPGDLVTPEQYQPSAPMTVDGVEVAWEACQTMNGSWGYDRDNHDFKSVDTIVKMLIDGVSNNGNMLLNVGPTGRGRIEDESQRILGEVGAWMDLHARSIYGCGPSGFTAPADGRYTRNGDRLYLHLFSWPPQHVHLPGLAGKVRYAQLLNDASEIHFSEIDPDTPAVNTGMGGQPAGTLTLNLPVRQPGVAVPVVELFLTEDA